MTSSDIPVYKLNDGHVLPQIGLGTYQVRGMQGVDVILSAIQMGYRLIDTSTNYDSEGAVGEAIRRSGIPRSEFYVTSKLPGQYHHREDALKMIEESLLRMGLDYLDLYLIHWPLPKRDNYVEAWTALVEAQKRGLIRSIGVSNFEAEHLDRIIDATGVVPAVNQNEIHPYWIQENLLKDNQKRGILTEAWSPLGRGSQSLKEDVVATLADKYHKNVGQIILRWHIQRGILPIPKAGTLNHLHENIKLWDFELTQDEVTAINRLTQPDGRVDNQDPNTYEEFN
ncbi:MULTISPECIES: aldo/keto reductase [Leuconostoc]|uniref:Oxidoreductase n=1 Tax=Leuconostoc kimchii (strain IMSNU 11154 / KCTC 2386 / IH25) TaxID=762051 RepID=D5T0B9_LEUKI|nr:MULTISPECIES: aldo/keto reductase [Leuconostoc]ADG39718.1 oxidoreductase [Leuconostoc kimchii IMSNU 11154]AEJ30422.1 oxidoreductase [Leuconostoc sp. C2]